MKKLRESQAKKREDINKEELEVYKKIRNTITKSFREVKQFNLDHEIDNPKSSKLFYCS